MILSLFILASLDYIFVGKSQAVALVQETCVSSSASMIYSQ